MTHLAEEVEVATRGRGYLATLAGRHVTVVGLAKSGIAAARLLAAAGADVCGTDAKPVASLGPEGAALATAGVRLVDGPAAFDGVELFVVSPGVPLDGEQLAPARARPVPVIGELELAWRAMEAETIAITGTNGKTTTTALTGALLAEQPRPVFVGGNIGTPLAAHALDFPAGGLVHDGWLVAKLNGHVDRIAPLAEIQLRGAHNVENVLAATACALWTGIGVDAIRRAVARFRAVPHRIEFVRDIAGVQFYNDSKGTNVASTIKALESFSERIVLIAGGKGKGQDFTPLADAARGRVSHAVVIGEDGDKIAAALASAGIGVSAAETLASAIEAGRPAAPAAERA